ncbi:MAG: SUF system NifU family Fe-S cluster assembly protein [Dialister micraerophilus]|uniref:Fe-S cluster assembly sulfur transfer protein SufU n=1 Tax=Dialister micraerophilus TaxID=309120 RepID=UPI00254F6D6F|nr:SUF system NifU family Fe-S cluster assembly protein [Dialister micraerophilus]MDK8252840.1 SUF system NifU family Fe-S cluster assembly protein [Dialister micraerophilus]
MNLQQLYTDLILEYNQDNSNKRNIDKPTIKEHGHNPSCGDDITIEIKLEGNKIADLAYTGSGCAISQASTAMMIEIMQGRDRDEAMHLVELFIDMIRGKELSEKQKEELEAAISLKDISKMPARVKCAVLGWHTIEKAFEKH